MNNKIILLIIFVLCLAAYFFITPINTWINESLLIIKNASVNLDLSQMAEYLRSFGYKAWIVSFCLMVLSCILAPIPAFIITLTNAAVFGFLGGAFL